MRCYFSKKKGIFLKEFQFFKRKKAFFLKERLFKNLRPPHSERGPPILWGGLGGAAGPPIQNALWKALKGPKPPNGHFGPYLCTNHPYGISNTPQTIYFWKLLIEMVILSYKTLKSNNFEKMTYNENWNFEIDEGGFQNYFWTFFLKSHF